MTNGLSAENKVQTRHTHASYLPPCLQHLQGYRCPGLHASTAGRRGERVDAPFGSPACRSGQPDCIWHAATHVEPPDTVAQGIDRVRLRLDEAAHTTHSRYPAA